MGDTKPVVPFQAPKFDWNRRDIYEHWFVFKQRVEFSFAGHFKDCSNEMKINGMLSWMGDQGYTKLLELLPAADDRKTPKAVIDAFEDYFKPAKDVVRNWIEFSNCYSNGYKTMDDFANRLKDLARKCEFSDPDQCAAIMFLGHCQNTKIREKLIDELTGTTMKIEDMVKIARTVESADVCKIQGSKYMEGVKPTSNNVDAVKAQKKQHQRGQSWSQKRKGGSGSRQRQGSNSKGGNC